MQTHTKIYELKSDLLERKFRFWNSFNIILYDDSIFVSKKELWGVNYEEKTFEIENIDSIYLKKKFNTRLFLAGLVVSMIFLSIGDATDEIIVSLIGIGTLLLSTIFGFIGEKVFIIGSHNDKIQIRFSAVPRRHIDEIKTRVIDLKRKYKQSIYTNLSINNSIQQDYKGNIADPGIQHHPYKPDESNSQIDPSTHSYQDSQANQDIQEVENRLVNSPSKDFSNSQDQFKTHNNKRDSSIEPSAADKYTESEIADDFSERLVKLKALYDDGVITLSEYEKLKGGILEDI